MHLRRRILNHYRPRLERLEDRTAPALLASQVGLHPPVLTGGAFDAAVPQSASSPGNVDLLLQRAAAATPGDDAIVAVVDRAGNILGVRVEGNVAPQIQGNPALLAFAIDGAVSLARTGAFFSSDADPLTSRTVQFISQSTVTQREVDSYTFLTDPASTVGGPGFVAPIEIGGHFPPNVPFTPQVDLFGIENTNRDLYVGPGPDGRYAAGDQTPFGPTNERFNIPLAFVPPGQEINPPLSYSDAIMSMANQRDPAIQHVPNRGIATLPGGLPIYKDGVLVGGIGVFFPGTTGFASEENSMLSANFDPSKPDKAMEAEAVALIAEGGSSQAGFRLDHVGALPPVQGIDLPFPRIDLAGITLDTVGPGGLQGPQNLVTYFNSHFSGSGNQASGVNEPVDFGGDTLVSGETPPQGWLVTPHSGGNMTAQQVEQIIDQGIVQANQTRAQIRPLGSTTQMVLAVSDSAGEILGLYRMPDAPIFSIGVAVSKARDVAYYNDATQVAAADQLPGIPPGAAFTNRTFRYLALPHFPEGIDYYAPGPWSILNDPGTDRQSALDTGAPEPISAFQSVFGFDAFHPNTTFRKSDNETSGVVFFPGSSGVYVSGQIVGGFGVSGDGVLQDDVVTAFGISGFEPPGFLRADQFFLRGVRLPYMNFPRNPNAI